MKIGLLVGGDSPERDVSLSSGKAIHKALELLGNNVIVLDTFNGIRSLESKILNVDLIFNGLHGGDGENGNVAAYLESLNIPFTGSDQDSSKICMDKDLSKKLVSDKGIGTPKWIASSSLPSESQLESLGLPIIVKPNDLGSTIGLSLVKDKIEIGSAFKIASNFADSVMFESFILGREITVPIIGSNSYSIVEIVPKKNLEIVKGQKDITFYQFNTNVAKHFFCNVCGISTHSQRRSDPNTYGTVSYTHLTLPTKA